MGRLSPKAETVRSLFAKSWNRCAFPGCTQILVNNKGQFLGQICHIEAAAPGGERYNENMNDEDRRHHNNLILLCYPHHIETNDVEVYTVGKMRELKTSHESRTDVPVFKINESHLHKIILDSEKYWAEVEVLANYEASIRDLAMEIESKRTFSEIIRDITSNHEGLFDTLKYQIESSSTLHSRVNEFAIRLGAAEDKINEIRYYDHPFREHNWERLNLGVPNTFTKLKLDLTQLEILYLEEFLKTNQPNEKASRSLEELKARFKNLIRSSGYVD